MRRLLWILPALLIISETVWGQRPAPPDPKLITIRLGRAAGPPDGRVSMAVSLIAAEAGARIGTLQMDLSFPTALLASTGAEPAGLSLGVNAALKTETRADAATAKTHLLVTLSTLESSKQSLPDGQLAYLLFHISNDAKLGTEIPVDMSATAISVDVEPVAPMTVQGNSVIVDDAERRVFPCFFYMH